MTTTPAKRKRPDADFLTLMRNLRAVREYTQEPVDDATLNQILEVARWTGTGSNKQPTDIVVVRDPEVKRKMGEWGALPADGTAVVFLLATLDEASAMDEGRYAERIMLAARALALGSCRATLKNEGPDEIKKLLGIPNDRRARVEAGWSLPLIVGGAESQLHDYPRFDNPYCHAPFGDTHFEIRCGDLTHTVG